MILGIYLVARAIAWILAMVLVGFVGVVCLIWMALCAIGRALMDPDTWRSHPRQPPPRVPPSPRNPRMYHSDRR